MSIKFDMVCVVTNIAKEPFLWEERLLDLNVNYNWKNELHHNLLFLAHSMEITKVHIEIYH
ncbi:hypothetical protein QF049_004984 [Paenibacillus sp. W4I10]|nr:hypothetical protein [Paenibacillus sp. W4I10]